MGVPILDWKDAKIYKPTYMGMSDPVLCLLDDGIICVAQYDADRGEWYDAEQDEYFRNVVWFFDFTLPHGWKMSDLYDKGVSE